MVGSLLENRSFKTKNPDYEKAATKARVGKKVVLSKTHSTCKGPEARKGLPVRGTESRCCVFGTRNNEDSVGEVVEG